MISESDTSGCLVSALSRRPERLLGGDFGEGPLLGGQPTAAADPLRKFRPDALGEQPLDPAAPADLSGWSQRWRVRSGRADLLEPRHPLGNQIQMEAVARADLAR
jgi:hypothetical protein